jgi:hypothetical protein
MRLRLAVPQDGNPRPMALGGWLAHAQILGRSGDGFNHNYLTGLNFLDGFYIRRRTGLEYSRLNLYWWRLIVPLASTARVCPPTRVHLKEKTQAAG